LKRDLSGIKLLRAVEVPRTIAIVGGRIGPEALARLHQDGFKCPTNSAWITIVGVEDTKTVGHFDSAHIQGDVRESPPMRECHGQLIDVSSKLDGKAREWHFELRHPFQS
jgi:hypothetical protein